MPITGLGSLFFVFKVDMVILPRQCFALPRNDKKNSINIEAVIRLDEMRLSGVISDARRTDWYVELGTREAR